MSYSNNEPTEEDYSNQNQYSFASDLDPDVAYALSQIGDAEGTAKRSRRRAMLQDVATLWRQQASSLGITGGGASSSSGNRSSSSAQVTTSGGARLSRANRASIRSTHGDEDGDDYAINLLLNNLNRGSSRAAVRSYGQYQQQPQQPASHFSDYSTGTEGGYGISSGGNTWDPAESVGYQGDQSSSSRYPSYTSSSSIGAGTSIQRESSGYDLSYYQSDVPGSYDTSTDNAVSPQREWVWYDGEWHPAERQG